MEVFLTWPMRLWAQAMGIQRFVFYSIQNCEKHPEVPLMLIKNRTEEFLRKSGLNFTIFRLCGFMQVLLQLLCCCSCGREPDAYFPIKA